MSSFKQFLESGVVDLKPRIEQKRSREKEHKTHVKSQAMINIDHAVAATIDHLKRQGMTDYEAYQAVMTHLNDLALAFELQGGMTD